MSRIWRYGDHVDTDVIIPARYLNIADFKELAEHAMEDIDTSFSAGVQTGDVLSLIHIFHCLPIVLPVLLSVCSHRRQPLHLLFAGPGKS